MQHRFGPALALLAATLLSACAQAPLSFVEGQPLTRTDSTLYPVRVVAVDGSMHFNLPRQAINIAPGVRELVLESGTWRGASRSTQRHIPLTIEPCTHYYLAARHASPFHTPWELVVDRREEVAGCDKQQELKKAGL